jgi:hypothetical protein
MTMGANTYIQCVHQTNSSCAQLSQVSRAFKVPAWLLGVNGAGIVLRGTCAGHSHAEVVHSLQVPIASPCFVLSFCLLRICCYYYDEFHMTQMSAWQMLDEV